MMIDGFEFPNDLLYDSDGLVWARPLTSGDVRVGITSIYAAIAGRIAKVSVKTAGLEYAKGAAIGFLESGKYFCPIRAPRGGGLQEVNPRVLAKPRTMTEAVYGDGWVARVRPSNFATDRRSLLAIPAGAERLAMQIAELRVRCFAAFPDHEMFEIGTQSAALLVKLNEMLGQVAIGGIVHLVTDGRTGPIATLPWSAHTR